MRTSEPQEPMPKLRLVGTQENGDASSPYGPKRAGLITTQPTNKVVQLSELLNDCEKRLETLESRYFTALDTFIAVTNLLVKRGAFIKDTDTTKEEEC